MAQRLRELFPERSALHALGAALRSVRIERGLSQARLGDLVHHSGTLIAKIEKAERLPTAEFCARVDTALDTGDRLSRMWPAADPRRGGIPVEFIVSPWNVPTSVRLLRQLTGQTARGREIVALTSTNRETLLAGQRAAVSAPAVSASPGAPPRPPLGAAALDLIAARLTSLDTLTDVLPGPVLRDLLLAELRCLTDLIDNPAAPVTEHRRLLTLAARAARLSARLHQHATRPGDAQSFYLAALRCTTDAGDPHTGTDILAEIDQHLRQVIGPRARNPSATAPSPLPSRRRGRRSAAAARRSS